MNFSSAYKFGVLATTLIFSTGVFAQSLRPPKIESPNAASMGKFGEVPVSLFTGVPDITVPIYTLSYGKMQVPVSLKYHPGSVKPAQHPGWVGSGWDLASTGNISRQVRGTLDEFYIDPSWGNATSSSTEYYYPQPNQSPSIPAASELTNGANWYTPAQLNYYYTIHSGIPGIDPEADEFSFNVLGHSGKFYYSGATKGWEVVSDEKIKVELNGFINGNDITNLILSAYGGFAYDDWQPRAFSGFTLTVPDGTKYIFGGPDAIEFYSPYGMDPSSLEHRFSANNYLLTKIIDPDKNEITFSYTRYYPTCNLSLGLNGLSGTCQQTGGGPFNFLAGSSGTFSNDYVDHDKHGGSFQWPMYLSTISTPAESISFYTSNAVALSYSADQLRYPDVSNHNVQFNNSLVRAGDFNNIKWQQLDAIKIVKGPSIIKQFQFTYTNLTDRVQTLLNFKQLDNKNNVIAQYGFDYYNASFLPLYDGNYCDHWGFYNGTDISFAHNQDIFSRRQPNALYGVRGLLYKITYPTGGYSTFTWEGHTYSQLVAPDRQSLSNTPGTAGGNRIFEIQSYTENGKLAYDKKYFYCRGYAAGTDPATLPSSGILNGIPQYYFSISPRTTYSGNVTVTVNSVSLYAEGNYSYNGSGSYIGYDEVTEVNEDGSYSRNFFTSYGADLNGVSHFDVAPVGYTGWIIGTDTYIPFSSLELERGKPIGEFLYSASGTPLKKTVTTYRSDAARFNSYVNLINFHGSYGSSYCADALLFAAATQVFKFDYYPVSKTVSSYDQSGANPVVQTINFTYNNNNLVQTQTTNNSKSETLVTNYKYPTDYTNPATDGIYLAMANANMISPVIETSSTVNGSPQNLVKTNYSQPFTGIFLPQNLQIQVGSNPIETREQVNLYDSKGHILEIQKTSDIKESYIWGYNSCYPVAIIIGADYNTAISLVDQVKLNQAGQPAISYTDADIRAELNNLRTSLTGAIVTTYTYRPGVGITSVTDAKGVTSYYVYDDFARLSYILDKDKNLLKRYCYNYFNQPEGCSVTPFYNDQQQATFTKSPACGSGMITPTYTYTIAANTYSSFIDKATANQLAIDALNTNGQAAANALPCLAPFSGLNTTSQPWTVTVTTTGFNNTYSVYPGSTATVFGNIPTGTYTITLNPMYAGSVTSPIQLVINGTTYSGMTFTLNNFVVSSPTSFTLQNIPGGPCSFSMLNGFTSQTNSVSTNGSTVSYLIAFSPPTGSPVLLNTEYTIATINGSCKPGGPRSFTVASPGRSWQVSVSTTGQFKVKMTLGSTFSYPVYVSISGSFAN